MNFGLTELAFNLSCSFSGLSLSPANLEEAIDATARCPM
jgi:hypothetical protein